MKRLLVALVVCLALFGFPAQAFAHQVQTDYFLQKNDLEFQSTFSTGEPFVGATVSIYAPNDLDNPWLQLITDDQGRFAFMPDLSILGDWNVAIEQGGHADYWTVPVGENGILYDQISLAAPKGHDYAAVPGVMPIFLAVGTGALTISLRKRWQQFLGWYKN